MAALGGTKLPGGKARPLGAQLLSQVLELAASKVTDLADLAAFEPPGVCLRPKAAVCSPPRPSAAHSTCRPPRTPAGSPAGRACAWAWAGSMRRLLTCAQPGTRHTRWPSSRACTARASTTRAAACCKQRGVLKVGGVLLMPQRTALASWAESPGAWLRSTLGTNRCAAHGSVGGCGAAVGRSWRSCGLQWPGAASCGASAPASCPRPTPYVG